MQAFLWRQLVVAENLTANVTGRWAVRVPVALAGETPLKIPVGGTAQVRFSLPAGGRGAAAAKVQLELNDPPTGIAIQNTSLVGKAPMVVFKSDSEKTQLGLRGNLIVNVYVARSVPSPRGGAVKAKRRILVGVLPAIPFEVVAGSK